MISDKVRPHHLERKAILYVRQSSAHQVLHNRESSALQYAMRDRLTALGWLVDPAFRQDAPPALAPSAPTIRARGGVVRQAAPKQIFLMLLARSSIVSVSFP